MGNINLAELTKEIHGLAVSKGWWSEFENLGEASISTIVASKIALIHSELSEALEAVRDGCYGMVVINNKPEGVVVELADTIIRILDLCGALDLDIEEALSKKIEYNKTRPYKHGGKKI